MKIEKGLHIIIIDNITSFLLRFSEVLIMYSMNDMTPVTNVQGPIAGPIDYELLDKMHHKGGPLVAYKNGNKYVKISSSTISISWDIHR